MIDAKSSKPGKNKSATTATALGIDELNELALNLHWSWNHAADALWRRWTVTCGSQPKIRG
jgi:starch phosphorylase